MQILGLLGMYLDAVVVEVKTCLLLFRLALAILCTKGWHLIFSLDDLITVPLARFRQGTKAVFWFNFLLTT